MIIKSIKNIDTSYLTDQQIEADPSVAEGLSGAKYSAIERLRYINSIITQRIKFITHYSKSAISLIDDILNDNVNIEKRLATKSLLRHNRESILSSIEILENKTIDVGYYDHLLEGNYIEILTSYSLLSEFLSDFTNTILFRNYNIGERVISTINSKIPKEHKDIFKSIFKLEEVFFYNFNNYAEHKLKNIRYKDSCVFTSLKVYYENIGFKKNIDIKKSIFDRHFSNFEMSTKVATIDISKFFNSISSSKFIQKNIFNDIFKILISYDDRSMNLSRALLWESESRNGRPLYEDYESSFNDMEFLIEYESGSVKLEPCGTIISFISQLFNFTISYLTHNGRLPTGASYSPVLSNTYMLIPDIEITKSINTFLENGDNRGLRISVTRYADDITLSGWPTTINMELIKTVESTLNSYGLYIKYSKTKFYDANKSRANVMGLTFRVTNSNLFQSINKFSIVTNSKYRKEVMDIINNVTNLNDIGLKEIGKINYYIKSAMSMVDLSFNLGLSAKSESFNRRFTAIDFSTFKGPQFFATNYSLANEIRKLDICGIDGKLSYKDIIHRLKNSGETGSLINNTVANFNDISCNIHVCKSEIINSFVSDSHRDIYRSDFAKDKAKLTLFKYLKAAMFISKYFINDDLDVLNRNRYNICFKATDGAGGIIAKISFKDKLLWTHGKFSTSGLRSDRLFELVFTKEILDSIQIGRV